MRRTPGGSEPTERQVLILSLVLAVLVATSVLYCLGIASVALRDTLSGTSLPLDATFLPRQGVELTPIAVPQLPTPSPPN